MDHSKVIEAIAAIKEGKIVVLMDDESRENEGDLVFAAEFVSPEKINFMAKEGRGLICLALGEEFVNRLQLPMMNSHSSSTPFTVSIEAREGVTTGISAKDRAQTIKVAIADGSSPKDISVPGHVFPLKAQKGGVLKRTGHTEGSVDLAKLAGLKNAAVICEVVNEDGTMARRADLEAFALKHEMPILSINDLVSYRMANESLLEIFKTESVKTPQGEFLGVWFSSTLDQGEQFALVKGYPFPKDATVHVRVQRQSPLEDVFGLRASNESTSKGRIEYSLGFFTQECEFAAFIYLQRDNSFASFFEEVEKSTFDSKALGTGAQVLKKLGIKKMILHVRGQKKLSGLLGFDLEIQEMRIMQPFYKYEKIEKKEN